MDISIKWYFAEVGDNAMPELQAYFLVLRQIDVPNKQNEPLREL